MYSFTITTFWAGTLKIAKWAKHRWVHSPNEDLGLKSDTFQISGMGKYKVLWGTETVQANCAFETGNKVSWGKFSWKVISVGFWTTEILQAFRKVSPALTSVYFHEAESHHLRVLLFLTLSRWWQAIHMHCHLGASQWKYPLGMWRMKTMTTMRCGSPQPWRCSAGHSQVHSH